MKSSSSPNKEKRCGEFTIVSENGSVATRPDAGHLLSPPPGFNQQIPAAPQPTATCAFTPIPSTVKQPEDDNEPPPGFLPKQPQAPKNRNDRRQQPRQRQSSNSAQERPQGERKQALEKKQSKETGGSQQQPRDTNRNQQQQVRRPQVSNSGRYGNRNGNQMSPHQIRRNLPPPPKRAKERIDHAGVRMTGNVRDCLICCQKSDLYGIGACLHPTCMECAIRMRVCGESIVCPQCRVDIGTLYFVPAPKPPAEFQLPKMTMPFKDDVKYKIKFENQYAIECFESYMAHKCSECYKRGHQTSFPEFAALRHHVGNVHKLSFCHLCTENLNVLTKDRKMYTRDELQRHMDRGDAGDDNSGLKGHPKCLFCELRFYDDEDQYRHLRRDHFFCQICDIDGSDNYFYKNHRALMAHYKKAHHPCLHGECEKMGIAFRSEMELNLHKAKQHSGRPLQLDFNFSSSRHQQHGEPSSSCQQPQQNEATQATPVPSAPQQGATSRIVPSAMASQGRSSRIIQTSFLPDATHFPAPNPDARYHPTAPYGAPPNWREQVRSTRTMARTAAPVPVSLQSGEQFPSLSAGPSILSTSNRQVPSVWAGGKSTRELFKESEKKPPAVAQPKRHKVIPSPDIWPEGMQERLRARELGLPDPDPPAPPVPEKKKEKKKKSKTASISAVVAEEPIVPTSSKFGPLAAYDLSDDVLDKRLANGKVNWWSQGGARAVTLKPTDGEFCRIELSSSHGEEASSEPSLANNKAARPLSLRSIAMGLESNGIVSNDEQWQDKVVWDLLQADKESANKKEAVSLSETAEQKPQWQETHERTFAPTSSSGKK